MTDSKKSLNILITGASSGIGKAIALEMAKDHHSFFLIGRNQKKLTKVLERVRSLGSKGTMGIGDIQNAQIVEDLYNAVMKEYNSIDVLIANAGVGYFGWLEEMTLQQYEEQFDTNVKGVFLWMKKVLPQMKQRNSGQIIVTSSNLGLNTAGKASIYSATKHAVQAMIGCLREELKGTMIKAATLNPGSVDTPWFDGKDVNREKMLSPQDIAKAARLIITQSKTSNINHILISPGKF
jgi:NADP-dependent 3-hydroxy acid dehydrogenase YdfG